MKVKNSNATTKNTLQGTQRLPLDSSLPGKGKAECLSHKIVTEEDKEEGTQAKTHADGKFLPFQ